MLNLILFATAAGDLLADPLVDLAGFARLLMQAAQDRNWALLISLALIGAVAAVRHLLGQKVPFLKTDLGGTLLVLVMGTAGGVATALLAGTAFSWALIPAAAGVAFTAAGGYTMLRRLVLPLLTKALQKAGLKADPVAEAEKAGESAVAEKPAGGIAGILEKK